MSARPRDPRCPIGWGNTSGYSNHHCRCAYCRADWTAYNLRRRDERRAEAEGGHPFAKPYSWVTYNNYQCRCDLCTDAWRRYRITVRARAAQQGAAS